MARALSALIALLALLSLGAQAVVVERLVGPRPLAVALTMLAFFTIWAGVAALLVHGAAAVRTLPAGWHGAALAWTALVGAAFHLLLARDAGAPGSPFASGLGWWSTQGLHTALPLLVLLHWLALAPKAGLSWRHALLWLLLPLLYLLLALGQAGAAGSSPYPFLDPSRLGWAGVARSVLGLLGAVLLLHGGIVGAARLMSGPPRPAASVPAGPRPR